VSVSDRWRTLTPCENQKSQRAGFCQSPGVDLPCVAAVARGTGKPRGRYRHTIIYMCKEASVRQENGLAIILLLLQLDLQTKGQLLNLSWTLNQRKVHWILNRFISNRLQATAAFVVSFQPQQAMNVTGGINGIQHWLVGTKGRNEIGWNALGWCRPMR